MNKRFVSAQEHLEDSFRLAVKIYESGFRPDYIIGLWRGGTPVGIIVHDFLAYVGIDANHISVRTSYRGMEFYNPKDHRQQTRVHNTRFLVDRVNADDSVLIVDDVYSSGRSIESVVKVLSKKLRRNMAKDVRIATPWYKPAHNRTGRVPDYVIHESEDWLIMPHELNGLSPEEIKQHRPVVHDLAKEVLGAC